MPPDDQESLSDDVVDNAQKLFDKACDAIAELIVDAIEASLRRSEGREMHAPVCNAPDLIPFLFHDKTES